METEKGIEVKMFVQPESWTVMLQKFEVTIMPNLELTSEEISRLRLSFFELIPVSEAFSQEFYARLFAKHPEVRTNFKSDIRSQQDKLVDTLAILLDTLDRADKAVDILKSLGQRHASYGATPELYAYVEIAFLELVAQYVPQEERFELGALWSRLMKFVSETMLNGTIPES